MPRDLLSWVALGVGVAVIVVAAPSSWPHETERQPTQPADLSARPVLARTADVMLDRTVAPEHRRSSHRLAVKPGLPVRLRMPSLGVSAAVTPVDTDGSRVLIPPNDYTSVGWWSSGARPGARHGTTILAGHTVHTGGGALDNLGDTRAGDRIVIERPHRDLGYVVSSVTTYRKGTFARKAAHVFSQTGRGRVVIVTCGDWNGATYLSNVVVVATRPHVVHGA